MGADQSLIRATAAMAPKQWDYSGLMKGIAALGKYASRKKKFANELTSYCLLYTSPSPRDRTRSRMPSSA